LLREHNKSKISSPTEQLILVDENDAVQGYQSKAKCHAGAGLLHRAFSIFIINDHKQLLIQKRSHKKRLWPLYWSNSCCSHPRQGEADLAATQRRLQEELGFMTPLKFLFKFQYHARYKNKGSEFEICSVYAGRSGALVQANPDEIAEWKFISITELERELISFAHHFSPWFKLEWERIRQHYLSEIGLA